MRAKDALGRYGERLAARYLTQAGLAVLAQNWRCRSGEIDIVARDGDVLVFCEVKTRSGLGFGDPLEAVDTAKFQRLRRSAELFLAEYGAPPGGVRVDLIGVVARKRGGPRVEHVRGVC